ncbi:MAG: site-2 protease family protein [Candidatus Nanoarchaeia archaeon]|jgi:membrane-associated protease RseP (regulator of RpoE activity)
MDLELASIIVVYSIVFLLIYKNRKKFQVMDKIFFVYKWDKGVQVIKKFSKKYLIIFYTIGIPICLFFMVFGIKLMWDGAVSIISSPNPEPTVGLAIPGVRIPGSPIYVPFWYGIIALITIIFSHELSHGIAATIEKIKLKSTGVGLLLILPLAFVEPEQESYEKAKKISKIRMLIAGSFANICLAVLAMLVVNFIIAPVIDSMVNYEGVSIAETVNNGPADLAGVLNNSKIISINNNSISNITEFYLEILSLKPNDTVTLVTNYSSYEFQVSSNPKNESVAYFGVMVEQEWAFKEQLSSWPLFILNIPLILASLFMWISNLNFGIGIMNLFPLWITDGGKVALELINPLFKNKKTAFLVANYLFIFCMSLLIFNLLGPYAINTYNYIKPHIISALNSFNL